MTRVWVQLRGLLELGPADQDHWAALRVGVSVAIPVLILLAIGREDLSIYAVFGAFTGMYGRRESHQLRLRHQGLAAGMLVLGVSIGVALSVNYVHSWALVAVVAALAGVGSVFADHAGLRPVGPFFGLFALGACASVPLAVSPWTAIEICVGSAVLSLAVGLAGWLRNPVWVSGARRRRLRPASRSVNAASYVVAVAVAGSLSTLAGLGHPFWAMAAAAVPLVASSRSNSLRRGAHRILGTLIGVLVTAVILLPFGTPAPIVLAILVVLFQFPTELLMTRNYGLALVFFTPLILMMTQLAYPVPPGELLVDRALQTALGALVGIAVAFARHPMYGWARGSNDAVDERSLGGHRASS